MVLATLAVAATAVHLGATRPPRVARPTAELGRLDTLVAHPAAPAEARARAVRIRAQARVVDLRPSVVRDYRAARDSVVAAVRELEPIVAAADDDALRKRGDVAAALAGVDELVALLDAVPLDAEMRRTLTEARARRNETMGLLASGRWDDARRAATTASDLVDTVRSGVRARIVRYADRREIARWTDWIADAVEESRLSGGTAVVVDKDARRMTVYRGGRPVSVYRVDLGSNPLPTKLRQGDRATPEGRYRIVERKDHGRSRFGQALLLDYPNADDRLRLNRAIVDGIVPAGTSAGGLIEIHGAGGRGEDWTDGCVALADREMAALFDGAPLGTPVVIVGGDGTGPWARVARRIGP